MISPDIKRLSDNFASPRQLMLLLEQRQIPVAIWEQNPREKQKQLMPDAGRYSYLFIDPDKIDCASNPFHFLKNLLKTQNEHTPYAQLATAFPDSAPPFLGGFIGALGYEAAGRVERIKGLEKHNTHPELLLLQANMFIVWDHKLPSAYLVQWPSDYKATHKNFLAILEDLESSIPPRVVEDYTLDETKCEYELGVCREEFLRMVNTAKDYIAAGDIFQVVLSNYYKVNKKVSATKLYCALTNCNPSPYQFLLPGVDFSLLGSSPEMMLYCAGSNSHDRKISMRLVAGTYPRVPDSNTPDLCADPKEHAEHVMLVDHIRNDLGRVARIGSVKVENLCEIESYRDVHHLVSQVSASLAENNCVIDALAATFPIATLTGTPRIRAMEIIAELEQIQRGFFGGTTFLLGYNSFLESAVIIRSAVVESNKVEIHAGAGIVHDSVPSREFEECGWKASTLLDLLACSSDTGGRES